MGFRIHFVLGRLHETVSDLTPQVRFCCGRRDLTTEPCQAAIHG
jgi:hypothetical protein